ncbi:hypothetical protein TNCT_392241 [Trichonephila clavata]|uniref:Uncharacterized protein n=1 Tax=Trichonephila clavata TaxID=2740835 RepID=A0A8X6KMB8_TRICU|nr:hypothetical protein TNCT_392241 [Trichonephila clavata]
MNEVRWIAYKCSRKSNKLQCQEFKDHIAKLERLNQTRVPTDVSTLKPKQRRKMKRATGSPSPGGQGKKARSEQSLPPPTSNPPEGEISSMEESYSSDECSEQATQKDVSPAAVPGVSDQPISATLLPI